MQNKKINFDKKGINCVFVEMVITLGAKYLKLMAIITAIIVIIIVIMIMTIKCNPTCRLCREVDEAVDHI